LDIHYRVTDCLNIHGEILNKCPHCEKKAVTVLRKIFLSPGMPATCLACGKPVGVTYRHWLKAAWPGATVMIIAMFLESNLLMYGLSTVGFALMIWLHLQMVPLVAEKSGPK
jgi:hypothetical protein